MLMQESYMTPTQPKNTDVFRGTVDVMILQTLAGLGPLHGYGIARRLEQISEGTFDMKQGTIYPALVRLHQRKLISWTWGNSENNRRAKFYAITAAGCRRLSAATEEWERMAGLMSRVLYGTD
jgi:PadR family transcriptional regulator PadR